MKDRREKGGLGVIIAGAISVEKNQYMDADIERNLGEQPLASIMAAHNLKPQDLVTHSDTQLTYKMVSRAMKGRRLTPHVQVKVLRALMNATKQVYTLKDLFTY